MGKEGLMPALQCAPLRPGVLHLRSRHTQSQPFAHSCPGLEQDSALSFHPGMSLLDILREPPGDTAPPLVMSQPHR